MLSPKLCAVLLALSSATLRAVTLPEATGVSFTAVMVIATVSVFEENAAEDPEITLARVPVAKPLF